MTAIDDQGQAVGLELEDIEREIEEIRGGPLDEPRREAVVRRLFALHAQLDRLERQASTA